MVNQSTLDLLVIAAVVAIDDVRNAFVSFLASQDVLTLALLAGVVWVLRGKKFGLSLSFGLGKLRLFDGLLGKFGKA